jgi:hypothetical protein
MEGLFSLLMFAERCGSSLLLLFPLKSADLARQAYFSHLIPRDLWRRSVRPTAWSPRKGTSSAQSKNKDPEQAIPP